MKKYISRVLATAINDLVEEAIAASNWRLLNSEFKDTLMYKQSEFMTRLIELKLEVLVAIAKILIC